MKDIQRLLSEAKSKMNGYVALMMLRYGNLCVKADAISLLSVTVKMNGQESNIEDLEGRMNEVEARFSEKDT